MRAPVFKPLFFQVKPLPCGAAQKVSALPPRRPTRAWEAIFLCLLEYVRDHPSGPKPAGPCVFTLGPEVRGLNTIRKPSTSGVLPAAVLNSLANRRENRLSPVVFLSTHSVASLAISPQDTPRMPPGRPSTRPRTPPEGARRCRVPWIPAAPLTEQG